jgi:cytochrome c-type biogenesis protein CcmE
VRGRGNPVRLVIALSIAAALAVFLLYTSFAGGATPSLKPSQLHGQRGKLNLVGVVVGPVWGDAHKNGKHFGLRNTNGHSKAVRVVYHGSVPPLFRVGRSVFLTGRLDGSTFAATSLVTKCPSKYSSRRSSS